ncbi:MAG: FAD-dependent monooxygenase [Actinomycetota bacterium]
MTEAVVAGAGISGLAGATLLARLGLDVSVVERNPLPTDRSAGVLIQPNGVAVLETIGVLDALHDHATRLSGLRLLDERFRPLSVIEFPGGPGNGYALVVDRTLLHDALVGAARNAGVTLNGSASVTQVSDDGTGPTVIVDGEERQAELVVGADGVDSVTRSFVDPGSPAQAKRRHYVRALVDWSITEPLVGEYWTRRGIAGIFPCGPDRTYWYATATPAMERAIKAGDVVRLRRLVASAHPPLLQVVNALPDTGLTEVDDAPRVQARKLYRGSVVLVGNAANAMAPSLGLGASSALVDVGVLASELHRRGSVAEALAAYDSRRSEAVEKAQRDADRLGRVAHFTRGRGLRNSIVRSLPARLAAVATRRALQLDVRGFRDELSSIDA